MKFDKMEIESEDKVKIAQAIDSLRLKRFRRFGNFTKKAHDTSCCFVALLKTIICKNTKKSDVLGILFEYKNTLKYGIFDFYNLVDFRCLQIVAQRCNMLIENPLENRCSIH